MKSTQYTIRQVPPEVDKALRRKSREERKSLNEVVLDALKKGAGLSSQPVVHRDLNFLIGSWVEDPEFDKIIKEFDQIDPEMWK